MGKSYLVDGWFKANIAVVDKKSVYLYPKLINKGKTSVYLLKYPILWHARLGHVNYKCLKNLSNLRYIPKLNLKEMSKCEICVEAKFTKNSFHSIDWNIEPLDLIHSDLCDLKFTPTRGGKKYFITLIDDCTRYCYVYFLKSKDEAMNMFITYKTEVKNQLNKNIGLLYYEYWVTYHIPRNMPWDMDSIHLYLKDTVMLIGLPILRNQNQPADTYLL